MTKKRSVSLIFILLLSSSSVIVDAYAHSMFNSAEKFEALGENLTRVTMSVDYVMPFGPLGAILDKAKFAKSAEKGMETALYNVRGLLEGNGSIPVYITLDAYKKILAEKKKMNDVPVSTVLTAILEKYNEIEAKAQN